jgi:cell shape-determining protein MreD
VVYSLVSYFVGQQFQILSFDPDWNTQMFFHSLMHLSTAYSAYLLHEKN